MCAVWWKLPKIASGRSFQFDEIKLISNFAAGVFLITLLALMLTQIDRLMLAGLTSLSDLGHYTIAVSVSAGVGRLILPIFNALYPRFSRLVSLRDGASMLILYRQGCQLASVILSVIASVLIVFSEQIILLWTGDAHLSNQVKDIVAIMVAGVAINGLLNIPYAYQLANGWTNLSVLANGLSLLFAVPFCFWAISNYGMLGAASLSVVLNLANVFITLPIMHSRLMPGKWGQWFFKDSLPAILVAFCSSIICLNIIPEITRDLIGFVSLVVTCIVVGILTGLSSSVVRLWVVSFFLNRKTLG
ncbi:MATE family transporter [Oleiphilus messinensis]|uniref:MATE family transporter n=2 Tax=Oleiphilus messinensis TaxID=141451 RepID=A0A1Y0I958_9GAMM|nr:MATE family transporter [Oleiphilus messinensis]